MTRRNFFRKFGIAIFSVFVLNALASYFYWYQSFVWFDMMMHFFGGITVGLFFCFLLFGTYRSWLKNRKNWKIWVAGTILTLCVALLWEVMEFSVQHLFNIDGVLATPGDSVSDVICGLVGGLTALGYFFVKTYERD